MVSDSAQCIFVNLSGFNEEIKASMTRGEGVGGKGKGNVNGDKNVKEKNQPDLLISFILS